MGKFLQLADYNPSLLEDQLCSPFVFSVPLSPLRWKQDLCNVCFHIQLRLQDPSLSDEEKAEWRLKKELHVNEARIQRREMNTTIQAALHSWGGDGLHQEPCLDDVMDDLDVGRRSGKWVRGWKDVIVQCEDFGQDIVLPFFRDARPNRDYYTCNLLLRCFIVADCTNEANTVVQGHAKIMLLLLEFN